MSTPIYIEKVATCFFCKDIGKSELYLFKTTHRSTKALFKD